ncbi:DUF3750 domain-containing protein [Jannaschia seosinensis]|nr:DUF3750 domain-containing protein [Jannaschia seosinensis]
MLRILRGMIALLLICFLLPLAAAAIWWQSLDRPDSWRTADWSASGVLPRDDGAAIHVLAARTGGAKGAVAVHSWLVWKRQGDPWTRAEVVGWGRPVRRNAYAPDGRWYSNTPWFVGSVTGEAAEALIPRVEAAVAAYPNDRDTYRIWPGPNSNSFVAHVLREVSGIGAALPPNAVGKDYIGPGIALRRDAGGDLHLSAGGYAGLSFGPRTGLEVNLLGQAFGFDFARPALKLPGIGRVGT